MMSRLFCRLFGHRIARTSVDPDAGAFYQEHRPCGRYDYWIHQSNL